MASELRFDVTALDRASSTFLSLAKTVEKLEKKLDDLDRKDVSVDVDVNTAKADRNIGSFASNMQRRIKAAVDALPDIEIGADSSEADRKLADLRRQMAELSDKRIGVDIDASAALAEVNRLQGELQRLGRESPNVRVQADTAAASAALGEIERQQRRLNGQTARVKVDSDIGDALIKFAALGRAMQSLALPASLIAAGPQLLSLAAAAASAAGALGTIPAALGAAGAAVATLKIGFSGISDAFDAMGKSDAASAAQASTSAGQREAAAQRIKSAQQSLADAQEAAARTQISSARQVADAERALADAIEQADERAKAGAAAVAQARQGVADAIESAARRQESAEATLERAQVSARDAQEALNRAREDARERIEDLSLALSGAALDEESAQIRLERAQERLAKLGPNASALDMREAALGVRQAQQALAEVKERYGDIKSEAADANAKGVEGADNVVAAQRRVQDANRSVQDAEKGVTQARLDGARDVQSARDRLAQAEAAQARQQQQSQRAIADAERNLAQARQQAAWAQADAAKQVTRAQEALSQAQRDTAGSASAASKAADAYAQALAKLAPNAREFVQTIKDLKPRWDELTRSVQNNLFAGVAEQTRALADLYLPKLQTLFVSIAGSINRAGMEVAGFFRQADTSDRMQGAFDAIAKAIDIAAGAAAPLAQVLTDLFTTGAQFLPGFAQDFKDLADRAAEFIRTARGNGDLARWMQTGIDTVKQFGELLWNLGSIVATVFTNANVEGVGFLQTLVDLTGQVKEFLQSPAGNDLLTTVFTSIRDTVNELKPGLQAVWDAISGAISSIAPKIPGVAESFSRLAEKLAPFLEGAAIAAFNAFAFAFEVLSRIPTPVLVALAAALVALKGISAARSGIDSAMGLLNAFKSGGTFRTFISDLDKVIKKLTGRGGVKDSLDDVDREARDGTGGSGGKKTGRAGRAARGAGRVAGAVGGGAAAGAGIEAIADYDPATGRAGSASDVADTAGKLLTFDFGGIIEKIKRDVGSAPAEFEAAGEKIKTAWNGTWTWVGDRWNEFTGWLGEQWDTFTTNWNGFWDRLGVKVSSIDIGGWFSETWNEFTGWLGEQWDTFTTNWNGFWDGLGIKVSTAWDGITGWVTEKWNGLTQWLSEQWTGFTTGWNSFWDGLGTKVSGAFDSIKQWVMEKWNAFTGWLSEQWTGFTAGWNAFWDGVGQKASQIWDSIKQWVTEKWNGLTGWLSEQWTTFTTNWNLFWDGAGRKLSETWDNIKLWASTKWTELTTWLSGQWQTFTTNWNTLWDITSRFFSDRWEDIKRIANGAWTWIRDTVWNPLVDFVKVTIPGAFDRAVEAIRTAWDKIQEITARPVRFVVNTVYNSGIRPAWNALAGIVGLPALPERTAAFATGGVVPGYAPGRDTVPAILSPGEGILRPEATKAFGSQWINQVNTVARRGGVQGVQQFLSTGGEGPQQFAQGGVVAGQNFARSQVGKPYVWGGVGPNGYDCTGFLSAVTNAVLGEAIHRRRFATSSFGPNRGAGGFAPGTGSSFVIGVSPSVNGGAGHASGNLAGLNVESSGGKGVSVGTNARSPNDGMFPWRFFLPQAGGTFNPAPGSGVAFDPIAWVKEKWGQVTSSLSGLGAHEGTQWGRAVTASARKMASAAFDKLVSAATSWGGGLVQSAVSGVGAAGGSVVNAVRSVANSFGWGSGPAWDALSSIISRESSWNPLAKNPTSSASGLFQFLSSTWKSVGSVFTTDPAGQAQAGLKYIQQRYGSPEAALAFWNRNHWYDAGGYLMPGATAAFNGTGHPERVLTATQTAAFDRLVDAVTTAGFGRRGGDGASLIDLAPVVRGLQVLRGDVDHHADQAAIAAELRALRQTIAAGGGSAMASTASARAMAELGAF